VLRPGGVVHLSDPKYEVKPRPTRATLFCSGTELGSVTRARKSPPGDSGKLSDDGRIKCSLPNDRSMSLAVSLSIGGH
jgi:hypothetical protein